MAPWCSCSAKGSCVGCRILDVVRRELGSEGVVYLLDRISTPGDKTLP